MPRITLLLPLLMSLLACDQIAALGKDDDAKSASSTEASAKPKKGEATKEADDGWVAAPAPGEVPKVRVGGWARYQTTSKSGEGSGKWAIIEKRGSDEYLMDADVNFRMPIQVQAWLTIPDLRDRKTLQIKDLKARINNGPIQDFRKAGGGAMGKSIDRLFEQFISRSVPAKFEGLPQEDVEVPAGRFHGCYKWTQKEEFMGIKTEETIWTHPKVPLPAMVKMETTDGSVWKLAEYGYEGAKKSF